MTISLQSRFILSLNSENKISGFKIKEKKSCLKALAWLELSERLFI